MNRPTTSASNLFRRALCPGSARMEEGLPEDDSKMAREGQLLHDYAAHSEYDRAMLKPNQRDLLTLADELTETVIERVEAENKFSKNKPYITHTEETFGNIPSLALSGTPDLLRRYELESEGLLALVIDRKFGFNVVERADLNLQLRAYAVLTWLDLTEISYVAIVQPRAPYEERITIAKYTVEDIANATCQITDILKASLDPNAPLVAGEEQCRYCKAKVMCPAFRSAVTISPGIIEHPESDLSKAAKEAYLEERLAEISDDQLEKVIQAERLANMIHDPLYDEARKRIDAGGLTNFKLGKESEVRQVTDVRRAIALLSLAGLEKNDIFYAVQSMALGKIGDVVRKRNPNWTWKDVNDWINAKLKSVIGIQTRKAAVIKK